MQWTRVVDGWQWVENRGRITLYLLVAFLPDTFLN